MVRWKTRRWWFNWIFKKKSSNLRDRKRESFNVRKEKNERKKCDDDRNCFRTTEFFLFPYWKQICRWVHGGKFVSGEEKEKTEEIMLALFLSALKFAKKNWGKKQQQQQKSNLRVKRQQLTWKELDDIGFFSSWYLSAAGWEYCLPGQTKTREKSWGTLFFSNSKFSNWALSMFLAQQPKGDRKKTGKKHYVKN